MRCALLYQGVVGAIGPIGLNGQAGEIGPTGDKGHRGDPGEMGKRVRQMRYKQCTSAHYTAKLSKLNLFRVMPEVQDNPVLEARKAKR